MTAVLTKVPKAKPDWKTIEGLYLQGFLPEAIAHKTGIKANTIAVGLCKRGITKKRDALVVSGDIEAVGKSTRAKIAAETERIVDKLTKYDPKRPEMMNLHADTLQKVTKTASLVHGWGDSMNLAVIVAGKFTGSASEDSIEVESKVETAADGQQNEDVT